MVTGGGRRRQASPPRWEARPRRGSDSGSSSDADHSDTFVQAAWCSQWQPVTSVERRAEQLAALRRTARPPTSPSPPRRQSASLSPGSAPRNAALRILRESGVEVVAAPCGGAARGRRARRCVEREPPAEPPAASWLSSDASRSSVQSRDDRDERPASEHTLQVSASSCGAPPQPTRPRPEAPQPACPGAPPRGRGAGRPHRCSPPPSRTEEEDWRQFAELAAVRTAAAPATPRPRERGRSPLAASTSPSPPPRSGHRKAAVPRRSGGSPSPGRGSAPTQTRAYRASPRSSPPPAVDLEQVVRRLFRLFRQPRAVMNREASLRVCLQRDEGSARTAICVAAAKERSAGAEAAAERWRLSAQRWQSRAESSELACQELRRQLTEAEAAAERLCRRGSSTSRELDTRRGSGLSATSPRFAEAMRAADREAAELSRRLRAAERERDRLKGEARRLQEAARDPADALCSQPAASAAAVSVMRAELEQLRGRHRALREECERLRSTPRSPPAELAALRSAAAALGAENDRLRDLLEERNKAADTILSVERDAGLDIRVAQLERLAEQVSTSAPQQEEGAEQASPRTVQGIEGRIASLERLVEQVLEAFAASPPRQRSEPAEGDEALAELQAELARARARAEAAEAEVQDLRAHPSHEVPPRFAAEAAEPHASEAYFDATPPAAPAVAQQPGPPQSACASPRSLPGAAPSSPAEAPATEMDAGGGALLARMVAENEHLASDIREMRQAAAEAEGALSVALQTRPAGASEVVPAALRASSELSALRDRIDSLVADARSAIEELVSVLEENEDPRHSPPPPPPASHPPGLPALSRAVRHAAQAWRRERRRAAELASQRDELNEQVAGLERRLFAMRAKLQEKKRTVEQLRQLLQMHVVQQQGRQLSPAAFGALAAAAGGGAPSGSSGLWASGSRASVGSPSPAALPASQGDSGHGEGIPRLQTAAVTMTPPPSPELAHAGEPVS
eukprot:TRINITY_DN24180_c0_g1_i3.p1 TRINITY_DN24180_c0_g1~~TRINITY_DN24180_c0_g1_i3.p1  ORF type:complete len:1000 (+),score=223.72 TRINITY_DN24180_c0_g1_i3:74-3001(+)